MLNRRLFFRSLLGAPAASAAALDPKEAENAAEVLPAQLPCGHAPYVVRLEDGRAFMMCALSLCPKFRVVYERLRLPLRAASWRDTASVLRQEEQNNRRTQEYQAATIGPWRARENRPRGIGAGIVKGNTFTNCHYLPSSDPL